jgi:hypothetical protein
MNDEKSFLIDGVHSMAIHNGVARVIMMRLGVDGKATPTVELHIPLNSMKSILETFQKIKTN